LILAVPVNSAFQLTIAELESLSKIPADEGSKNHS